MKKSEFFIELLKGLTLDEIKGVCTKFLVKGRSGKIKSDLIEHLGNLIYPRGVKVLYDRREEIIREVYKVSRYKLCRNGVLIIRNPERFLPAYSKDLELLNLFDNQSSDFVRKVFSYYFGAQISEIIFELDQVTESVIVENPTIIWKEPVNINHKQYYLTWKSKVLQDDSKNNGMVLAVYDDGKKYELFFSEGRALTKMLDVIKTEDFHIRTIGGENSVILTVTDDGKEEEEEEDNGPTNCNSEMAVLAINADEKPNRLQGRASESRVAEMPRGFYEGPRRWVRIFLKGGDEDTYFVNFMVDTGSTCTWICKETRKFLNLTPSKRENNTKCTHFYDISINKTKYQIFPSEDCTNNKAVYDINLMGTDVLSNYIIIDNRSIARLTFANAYDEEDESEFKKIMNSKPS